MGSLYGLTNLRQCFCGREVLNIPALSLEKGVIYGLLGPNGAGKTTLMRILAFIDAPAEGGIRFMGETVRPEQAARCRARVVWVPQSPVMFTGSLLYNVEYPMKLKGVPRKERRERALELLEGVGLRALAKAPAPRLSGGEAQRGSIARALAAGAEVLLFDEPTASVDFRSRGEIIRLIHRLHEERGLSIIVTTHDQALAAALCREQIVLFDGKLVPEYPRSEGLPGTAACAARTAQAELLLDGDGGRLALAAMVAPNVLLADGRPRKGIISGVSKEEEGVMLRLELEEGPLLALVDAERAEGCSGRLVLGASLRLHLPSAKAE